MHLPDRFAALVAALAACLLWGAPVYAQPEIEIALAAAYDDYDNLELDAAILGLEASLDQIRAQGIRTPAAVETWLMYGIVRFAMTGDGASTTEPFVQALLIDPAATLHPYYATPSLNAMLDDARALLPATGGQAGPPPPPVQPPPPPVQPPPPAQPRTATMVHRAVREAVANRPIAVSIQAPPTLGAAQIRVQYRPLGAPQFYSALLYPQGDAYTWVGEIPAQATAASIQVDYFIEAIDARGFLLEAVASANQPIPIVIRRTSDSADAALGGGRTRAGGGGRTPTPGQRPHNLHIALGPGTGVGLATSPPNVYGRPNASGQQVSLNPGLASSPFHLGIQVGVPVSALVELIGYTRLQLVFLETGTQLEPLGGLKARYYPVFRDRVRFFIEGGVGGGDVSHLVYLAEQDTYDTTNEGPVHVGFGTGGVFLFSDNVGIMPQAWLMALFPRFSAHLDVTLSLYFQF
jgi:hypothetical protein